MTAVLEYSTTKMIRRHYGLLIKNFFCGGRRPGSGVGASAHNCQGAVRQATKVGIKSSLRKIVEGS